MDNDIVLDDVSVSRYAAVIVRGDTIIARSGEHTYYVEDLNSKNGILLNGEPETRMTQLGNGDELVVGAVHLGFRSWS